MTPIATYVHRGSRIPYANSGSAIVVGDVVVRVAGNCGVVGIASDNIPATTGTGELDIKGVWNLPKTVGEAFTDGQVLYWDTTTKALTGTLTGADGTTNRVGRSVGAFASAATSANVNLNVA